jgi:hypothetical protein
LRSSSYLESVILIFPDLKTVTLHLSAVKISLGNSWGSKDAFKPIFSVNEYKFAKSKVKVFYKQYFTHKVSKSKVILK